MQQNMSGALFGLKSCHHCICVGLIQAFGWIFILSFIVSLISYLLNTFYCSRQCAEGCKIELWLPPGGERSRCRKRMEHTWIKAGCLEGVYYENNNFTEFYLTLVLFKKKKGEKKVLKTWCYIYKVDNIDITDTYRFHTSIYYRHMET